MTTVLTGKGWDSWRKFDKPLDGFRLADFEARAWGDAFLTVTSGDLTDLEVGPGVVDDVYRVFSQNKGDGTVRGAHFHDLRMTNLRRGAFRFQDASDVLVENCVALSDGKGCKDIPVGFGTSNAPAARIVYRNCEAGAFVQTLDKPGQYPNGDGFSDEETTTDFVYEDCHAHDNADGGFDSKNQGVAMLRCMSERNNYNFRLWGSGTLTDCVSADPRKAHLMSTGHGGVSVYDIVRPVLRGEEGRAHLECHDGTPEDVITLVDPVVPEGQSLRIHMTADGRQSQVRVIFTEAGRPVPVTVQREGKNAGPEGSVLVTVTETTTTTTTRTYDAERPAAGSVQP